MDSAKDVTAAFSDGLPPVVGDVAVVPTVGIWTSPSPTITTTFTDSESVVTGCEYTTDGFSANPGTLTGGSPVWTCTAHPTGLSGLRWFNMRAMSAGGTDMAMLISRQVDETAPVTLHNAPAGWSTTGVVVTLSPTDSESGVVSTEYCVDTDNTCTSFVSGMSTGINTEGAFYVRFRSTDAVGNVEATKSALVRIDETAPTTTDDAPAGWSTSAITVTLTATDNETAIASTAYCIDADNTCDPSVPGASVSITNEGTNYLRYRSTDLAGNVEATKSAMVRIDSSAPSVAADQPAGSFFDGVLVTLTCSDSVSGCSGIVYTTNGSTPVWPAGGSTQAYTGPIMLTSTTTLKFLAQDVAGSPSDVQSLAYTVTPSTVRMAVAMGPAPANSSEIRVRNSFQSIKSFLAFDGATVHFGARVAMGDVDGDGASEIIVAKGEDQSNNSEVKVYELDGTPVSGGNVIAFSTAFRSGARVAAADFNRDGRDEIIVSTSQGGSLVRIFSYNTTNKSLEDTGILLNAIAANADGVNIGVSDVDGDLYPELITTPASKTAAPSISAWDVSPGSMGSWSVAAHPTFKPVNVLQGASGGGASVGSGAGTFFAVGTGSSAGRIDVYTDSLSASYSTNSLNDGLVRQNYGIELSEGDVDADGQPEIVMTYGKNPQAGTGIYVFNSSCGLEKSIAEVFPGAHFGARTAVGHSNGL